MPRVIMFSPVASTRKMFSISARAAADHGAGHVKRSSAPHTMIQTPAKKCQTRRITMAHVVPQRKASNKKTTVLEAIVHTVESVGEA